MTNNTTNKVLVVYPNDVLDCCDIYNPNLKAYCYNTVPGLELDIGDCVLLYREEDRVAKLARVVYLNSFDEPNTLRTTIVAKVDTAPYANYMLTKARREKLFQELTQRRRELQEQAVYELLAKEDQDMATLLAEYKDLGGTFSD